MKIIRAWKHRKSGLIGLVAIVAVVLWPAIPLRSLDTWFQTLAELFPTNVFYPIMAVLVGSYVALYIYSRECKTCRVGPAGASASFTGVLIGACPACIPVIAFFLPLTVTVTLSYLSWIFLVAATIVLFFVLYKMEAFKKA